MLTVWLWVVEMAEVGNRNEGQVTEDYGRSTFSGRGSTGRISSLINMGRTYIKWANRTHTIIILK